MQSHNRPQPADSLLFTITAECNIAGSRRDDRGEEVNRIALRGAFRLKLEDETQAFAGKRGKILADIQKCAVVGFLPTGDLNRRVIPLLVTETQDHAAGFLLRRAA